MRRCLCPRQCARRQGVRSGHTEQCQSTRLRIQTPGLCVSRFRGVVGDIVFADRVHALDEQAFVSVEAHQHFRCDRRKDNWACIKALLTA